MPPVAAPRRLRRALVVAAAAATVGAVAATAAPARSDAASADGQVVTWIDAQGRPVFTRGDAPLAAAAADGLRFVGAQVDRPVRAFVTDDPGRAWQWSFDEVTFEQTWPTTTGDGVTVAVIDTGVNQAHPDLAGVVLDGRQVMGGVSQPGGTVDAHGHGTHVAGVIAAVAGNATGIAGGAPGVRILPVKVLDDNGSGMFSDVAAGLVWATDQGADVVNLSLGAASGVPDLATATAVDYAVARGVVVVAAAGNFGCAVGEDDGCAAVYPAALPTVLAVGAFDSGAACASYTATAPYIALGAPGTAIYSTYRSGYAWMSGTSMASPHVAAAAALVKAAAPGATSAQVRQLLRDHAAPSAIDPTCVGSGAVDPQAAVAAALGLPITPSAPSQPPAVDPATPTSAFAPVDPVRLLDTRVDVDPLVGGQVRAVAVRTVPGLESATAVAVSLTGIARGAGGYLTAWATGEPRPLASSLNLEARGVRSNAVVVPVGADGSISVWSQRDVDLVVDVTGAFVRTAASRQGRLTVTGPSRVLDTRDSHTPYAAGETRTVDLASAGVPADAVAAVVSLTAADSPRGWWAAWRADQPWGGTSTLNVADAATTISALVPLSTGRFQVRSQLGGHLVVDVTGWFTGPSADEGSSGLFVPMTPTRLIDTRASGRVGDGGSVAVASPPAATVPLALAANLTAVEPLASTFLTVFAADAPRPLASAANAAPGVITATGVVSPTSPAGFSVYAQRDVALVVDVTGYFVR